MAAIVKIFHRKRPDRHRVNQYRGQIFERPHQRDRRKVPIILGLVDLEDKAQCKPAELSGGEQQRVGLARALINNPKLIIADEPTGNVDPALSFEIVDLLSEINRHGTTVLMVTHEHSLVKHFHRRIVEIHNGRIVADSGKEAMIR